LVKTGNGEILDLLGDPRVQNAAGNPKNGGTF